MEAIKEILKTLQSLVIQFGQLSDQAREETRKGKALQQELTLRLSELEGREKLVKEQEGLLRTAGQLETEYGVLERQKIQIENAQKSFDRRCAEREAVISQKESDLASGLKALDEKQKALEIEKETYKQKLRNIVLQQQSKLEAAVKD